MAKILGYIISLVGLLVILSSSKIATLSFLSSMPKAMIYTVVAGVALIVIGLLLVSERSSSSKVKQASEEVPIYEGEGKKRKIVGYKKASKK
ncbi:hypothetical protein FJZ17_02300 [Candidatus Pacearchaeota archaeon]|nr:hypothetical protein [Candidatus Pacearchaeota archaeon]